MQAAGVAGRRWGVQVGAVETGETVEEKRERWAREEKVEREAEERRAREEREAEKREAEEKEAEKEEERVWLEQVFQPILDKVGEEQRKWWRG